MSIAYDVVIPTIGRPSLAHLLRSLELAEGQPPQHIIVVNDRDRRGPAWARNRGWQQSRAAWIAFLDDDVTVGPNWYRDLNDDIERDPGAGATSGRVVVPLPSGRRPTDWERNVKALETARWITADCAIRRDVLAEIGGFDERFRRAYREDSDFALRCRDAGYRWVAGRRVVEHEVRPSDFWTSVRAQAGNADDALMSSIYGRGWREAIGERHGALGRYAVIVAAATISAAAGIAWAGETARFAWQRIAPGPRTPREIATMTVTSAIIPFAAVYHRLRGASRS